MIDSSSIHHCGGGSIELIYQFRFRAGCSRYPFASQSKLKVAHTRLPFVTIFEGSFEVSNQAFKSHIARQGCRNFI